MTPLITQILQEILSREKPISEYTFILPSKRAGSYLINQLASLTSTPMFSPKIVSIEDFTEEISGLKAIDNTAALFEFYAVYIKCTPKDKVENFETFSSWAQTLLYDFNEIDRYLIDYKSVFNYLSNIKELEHWYLQQEKTPLIKNYLLFWEKLPVYYEHLKIKLQEKNSGYQGMVYRKASQQVEEYLQEHKNPHIFIGFNALNNAEQVIIQKMLKAKIAEIFWDVEEAFLNDPQHEASLFMRKYRKEWPYYSENNFKHISNNFSSKKNIEMVGIPKSVGQAKYVGELLAKLPSEELKNTAVVLGDEGLLLPVLNSLPPNVEEINVTMGFPLKNAPVAFLFEQLLKLHVNYKDSLYYKDIIAVSNHPLFQKITNNSSRQLSLKIQKENLIYISVSKLMETVPSVWQELFTYSFGNWQNNPQTAISNLQKIIFTIKEALDKEKDRLSLEFLYQFNVLFNKLSNLLETYPHITSIKGLFNIYKDLLGTETVDFKGNPFTGLQIMGMLETRALDFKNIILTSVNEGVLPAGKSSNSFIPYDLKREYHLPTYKEKDAVYTYHFYHLMQRAQHVYLLYNTNSEGLNAGEKSRFLLQLEMEKQEAHQLKKYNVTPKVPAITSSLQTVEKTPEILEKIKKLAQHGFSPSALTTYIRNPLDFYHRYILGIKEQEEVEETIAYNTLGTVVHNALETFYKNWEGQEVSIAQLKEAIKKTPQEVAFQFQETYTKEPLVQGKNLIIFEVAKRYVTNFLKMEMKTIQKGNSIKIIQVENNLKAEISMKEVDFPVFIRGKVDRVDAFNGSLRIIDYKTGKVQQNQVELVDWDSLTSDYDKYGKTFQVLTYAFMLNFNKPFSSPVEAGIISFKNLGKGFLKFSKKDKAGAGAKRNPEIGQDVLEEYKVQLKNLISEICNPEIPFQEKEIPQKSW